MPPERPLGRSATLGHPGVGRLPPRLATFAERDLRVVDRSSRSTLGSFVGLPLGRSDSASGLHQLIDEFLTEWFGQVRIGGSPAPTIDDDVMTVFGSLHVSSHTAAVPTIGSTKRRQATRLENPK